MASPRSRATTPKKNPTYEAEKHISVICRVRPLNSKEKKEKVVVVCDPNGVSLDLHTAPEPTDFDFDAVVDMDGTQEQMYDVAAKSIVQDFLFGYNGTLFAYGQTASGKTFTMEGQMDSSSKQGIIPRAVDAVVDYMQNCVDHVTCSLQVQFLEIYNEKVRDLLSADGDDLKVRETKSGNLFVDGATSAHAGTKDEVMDYLRLGASQRAKAETQMNEASSRSHSIFTLVLHQRNVEEGSTKHSKLYMVDLAGSEMVRKTGAEGATLKEAQHINRSLSALNKVISTLADADPAKPPAHIPYRDSKLTRILEEAIGGNCRTALMLCCSPAAGQLPETLSSLRFGKSAKRVRNVARINRSPGAGELKELLGEMRRRVKELETAVAAKDVEIEVLKQSTAQGSDEAVMRAVELEEANKELKLRQQEMESEYEARIKDLSEEVEILHAALDVHAFGIEQQELEDADRAWERSKVHFHQAEEIREEDIDMDDWTDDDDDDDDAMDDVVEAASTSKFVAPHNDTGSSKKKR